MLFGSSARFSIAALSISFACTVNAGNLPALDGMTSPQKTWESNVILGDWIRQIAEERRVALSVERELRNRLVAVYAENRSLQEALNILADSLESDWVKTENGFELRQIPLQSTAEQKYTSQFLKGGLATVRKELAACSELARQSDLDDLEVRRSQLSMQARRLEENGSPDSLRQRESVLQELFRLKRIVAEGPASYNLYASATNWNNAFWNEIAGGDWVRLPDIVEGSDDKESPDVRYSARWVRYDAWLWRLDYREERLSGEQDTQVFEYTLAECGDEQPTEPFSDAWNSPLDASVASLKTKVTEVALTPWQTHGDWAGWLETVALATGRPVCGEVTRTTNFCRLRPGESSLKELISASGAVGDKPLVRIAENSWLIVRPLNLISRRLGSPNPRTALEAERSRQNPLAALARMSQDGNAIQRSFQRSGLVAIRGIPPYIFAQQEVLDFWSSLTMTQQNRASQESAISFGEVSPRSKELFMRCLSLNGGNALGPWGLTRLQIERNPVRAEKLQFYLEKRTIKVKKELSTLPHIEASGGVNDFADPNGEYVDVAQWTFFFGLDPRRAQSIALRWVRP